MANGDGDKRKSIKDVFGGDSSRTSIKSVFGTPETETPSEPVQISANAPQKDRNIFSNIARTVWNNASALIPRLKGGLSATLNPNLFTSPGAPQPFAGRGVEEKAQEIREGIDEERIRLFKEAEEGQKEFQEANQGLVVSPSQVGDAIDAANLVVNSIAQAAVQIPAAILTQGMTSLGQEIGFVYLDQVRKIAEDKDMTPEEVIRKGEDDKASAIAYGSFAGALDFLGAKKVSGAVSFDKFKSSVANRGLAMLRSASQEGVTEGAQSIIEDFGSSRGAGDSLFSALTGISLKQAGEEALVGAIGGGGVSALTVAVNDISDKKSRLQDPNLSKEDRVNAENKIGESQLDAFGDISLSHGNDPFISPPLRNQSEEVSTPKTLTLAPSDPSQQAPFKRPGNLKRTIEKYFFSKGNMPQSVFERNLKRENIVRSELERAKQFAFDLNKAIKKEFEESRIQSFLSGQGFQKQTASQEQLSKVNDVLRGQEDPTNIPESLRGPVADMRNHVDRLSRRLIDAGVVEGDLEAIIDQNIGVYLNRSYRIHDDPKWAKKVPEDIKNQAKGFIRKQYKEIGEDLSDQQVNNIIDDILYNDDAPINILSGSKVGSKDYSILRKRKDIAPEIRALMGEHTDPVLNYARSVEKMSNLIESHRFLVDIREQGMGKFFFEEGDTNRPEGFNAKIAADQSEVMAPLNGLMTTPEIKQSFEEQFQQAKNPEWLEWYLKANAAVKLGKTAGSVTTQIRNVTGGMAFLVNSGHNPLSANYKKAVQTIKNTFRPTNKEARERVIRYKELGILAAGARSGEIQQYINDTDITGAKDAGELFRALEKGQGIFDKTKKKGQAFVRGLSNLYQAGDSFLRVLMFESEFARYRDAMPQASRQEVEEIAANIVRDTYQNYDVLPKAVREIQKIPLFGTFASFPAEVIRTSVNTAQQWRAEIKSDNPAIRKIGFKRMAGQIAATSIISTGMQKASQYFLGVDNDEDRDFRRFLPPWSKLSSIFYRDKGPGRVRYTDLSYTDPYEYIRDPIMHLALNGEQGFKERLIKSFGEFIEPFAGEEILVQHVREAVSNKKESGGRIYNPQDPEWFMDALAHVWKAFEPGALKQGKDLIQAFSGVTDRFGNRKDVNDAVAAFMGFRASEIDINQAIFFKGRSFNRAYLDDRALYNEVRFRNTATEREKEQAYEKAVRQFRADWEEMLKDIDAAYRLGIDNDEIDRRLEQARVPKWIRESLFNRRFRPFERK